MTTTEQQPPTQTPDPQPQPGSPQPGRKRYTIRIDVFDEGHNVSVILADPNIGNTVSFLSDIIGSIEIAKAAALANRPQLTENILKQVGKLTLEANKTKVPVPPVPPAVIPPTADKTPVSRGSMANPRRRTAPVKSIKTTTRK